MRQPSATDLDISAGDFHHIYKQKQPTVQKVPKFTHSMTMVPHPISRFVS